MRQRTWRLRQRVLQRRDDERGAELIEFAIVVVLLITLLYELRRRQKRYGLASACIGGGQGIAMIVEHTA